MYHVKYSISTHHYQCVIRLPNEGRHLSELQKSIQILTYLYEYHGRIHERDIKLISAEEKNFIQFGYDIDNMGNNIKCCNNRY